MLKFLERDLSIIILISHFHHLINDIICNVWSETLNISFKILFCEGISLVGVYFIENLFLFIEKGGSLESIGREFEFSPDYFPIALFSIDHHLYFIVGLRRIDSLELVRQDNSVIVVLPEVFFVEYRSMDILVPVTEDDGAEKTAGFVLSKG